MRKALAALLAVLLLVSGGVSRAEVKVKSTLKTIEVYEDVIADLGTIWAGIPDTESEDELLMSGPDDGLYILPTEAEIAEMVHYWEKKKSKSEYLTDAFDCDDFAREFHHLSHVWARKFYGKFPASVFAGSAYVHLHGDLSALGWPPGNVEGYHVINLIRRNDGEFFFFEPQNGVRVKASVLLDAKVLDIVKINL